jgi:hypothetical protein
MGATMLKKLFAAVRMTKAASGSVAPKGLYSPYTESHVNFLYNLLFCDDLGLFKNQSAKKDCDLWGPLLADEADATALLGIAEDEKNEGRVRALAYNRLRMLGQTVSPKKLLGVIVEVPLPGGLDVLAAFSEGGVRYLNQSGKVLVIEDDGSLVGDMVKELMSASQLVVDKIGPWEEQRLPPPRSGNVRLTFLVSDGLYFGEGPFPVLQHDEMAGPVLSMAARLLQKSVEVGRQVEE